ncbi:MAG: hypothetical protein HQL41_05120 [Alphaproteobacteria bacterium]|nr:hypothetical protein [Alphaproteobacteria bacterium]
MSSYVQGPVPLYLTRKQVERYFPVSAKALATLATRGGGPPMIKIGKKVVYATRDIIGWFEARRIDDASIPAKRKRGRPTKAEQIARRAAHAGRGSPP